MIKRRLGENFANSISSNLEVKTVEVARKDARGGKRKQPRENRGERGDRKPREQKEEKKEDQPAATEEAAKQEAPKT